MASKTQTRAITIARSAPAPVIKVQTPRVPAAPKRRSPRRTSGGGGGGGTATLMGVVAGAGVLGFLKKSGVLDSLPALPVVGRIGAAAIVAHLWAKHGGGKLARDISLAAGSIAAFQLGSQGSIDGEDESNLLGASLRL